MSEKVKESLSTNKLIDHLELNRLSNGLNRRDEKIIKEIIKRLRELDKLKSG